MTHSTGIHHITAIASDPARNLDFYTRVLGLRLIKKTVNYDDPESYHFYFSDAKGNPGSVLTFFPHPNGEKGRHGVGKAVEISLTIPESALSFWIDRFHQLKIDYVGPETRFDQKVLIFKDPDGIMLELIADNTIKTDTPWGTDDIPAEHAIQGFHSVTLWVRDPAPMAAILTDHFGFTLQKQEEGRLRYSTGKIGVGQIVDIRVLTDFWRGALGTGVIHHVAFRATDDAHEQELQTALRDKGFNVTEVIDRFYFHSVYFREPSGILFEIATDAPGFEIDETFDKLGSSLQLPAMHEPQRKEIEAALPVLS